MRDPVVARQYVAEESGNLGLLSQYAIRLYGWASVRVEASIDE